MTRAGDRTVRSADDLLTALEEKKPGETLVLLVVRDGEEKRVAVTLSTAP